MGHALEIIQADCIARFHRLLGKDLVFQTGSDEHGLKMFNTAKEKKVGINELIEENYNAFIDFYKLLNISYDRYVRTTSNSHKLGVVKFWNKLVESNDIYKGHYSGLYCVGCESYKTYNELVDGKCLNHPNREIIELKEENYFFKLSKYIDRLIEIYEKDEIRIVPKKRKSELLNLLKEGMEDISFSRQKSKLPWGIPVPNDETHVIYVWADALSNYITSIGYENNENEFRSIWPADIHLIGKDITKFHAIYWPAMLLSAGLPLFKKLFIHGFLTVEGSKIGKSLGNVSNPTFLVEKYGTPTFRFYLLKNISSIEDGSFKEEDLIETYNKSLADDLGNLILRVLAFVEKDFEGNIPELFELDENDREFIKEFDFVDSLEIYFEKFLLNHALERVWEFIRKTNKFINETEPWNMRKNDHNHYSSVIYILIEALRVISIYIKPFIPSISNEIVKILKITNDQNLTNVKFSKLNKGKLGKRIILFPKIDNKSLNSKKSNEEIQKKKEPKLTNISYEDFKKIDLRVATVESVEKIPKADKLFKLTIDLGSEKRTLVAGIAEDYTPDELLSMRVVVLANLEPRNIRGILSQGMLLAAVDGKTVSILTVNKNVKSGTKID